MERDIKPTYDELESYVENLQKQLADAQATIAALQAQVKELEQWVQDQSTANLETMRHTDEMQSRALEAEQQLTQRTAELEAIKADTKNMLDVATSRLREQVNDLQAELERVRGERDEYAHKTKMLCLQNGPLMIENHDMKKLIAALPKVEGEINERFCTGSYYSSPRDYRTHVTFEAALVALLKHRQGMEG